jgi:adenine specific DNA methylase Mod
MTKEEQFYQALEGIFIGAPVEGESGYINLMRIKSRYYQTGVFPQLQKDIEEALKPFPDFRDELFLKLYTFFKRYFSKSGSIYFDSTPADQNIYEKVYTDDRDVMLFWKTHMLYYVKTDRLFKPLDTEIDGIKFHFDVSTLEHKRANEKRDIVYEFKEMKDDVIVFNVYYSEKGRKTNTDDILRVLTKSKVKITEDALEKVFRIFEKQSEVDYFINKNAKAFLKEQFDLWLYQYVFSGESQWTETRIKQLQVLKDIAYKIIDFISQFEAELVRIWNKPKFVLNSNYVITLDRIADKNLELVEKILTHKSIDEQIKEWKDLGIIGGETFDVKGIFENSPSVKGCQAKPDGVVKWYELPYNPDLKNKARELRKAGNLSEVLLWNQVKNKKFYGLDFDRQKIIGNYIVDFYCKNLGLVIEIDGITHDGKIEYDEQRDNYIRSLGLKIIHILDSEAKNNLSGVIEFLEKEVKNIIASSKEGNTPNPSIRGEFKYLPIDTKYFKDLELEILSQFKDLDKSLDGWLIKSENYQALNTIPPKFKERVQTIYIDPPFNKEQDADYFYSVKYKDSSWITLLENRLQLARDILKDTGSIFVRCDYNGNMYVRLLLGNLFEVFRNEITVKRTRTLKGEPGRFHTATDTVYFCAKHPGSIFRGFRTLKPESQWKWVEMHLPGSRKDKELLYRNFFGKRLKAPDGRRWALSQEALDDAISKGLVKMDEKTGMPKFLTKYETLGSNWTDVSGYSPTWHFTTENSEQALQRVCESTTNERDIILDFFLGIGTTIAVAHKLNRKWIGVEMGEHFGNFYQDGEEVKTGVLGRMKEILAGKGNHEPCGISREVNWQGGGFFKYYELEQYEDTLRKAKYEDSDIFDSASQDPYNQYVFLRDLKMLEALEVDYENNKVEVDLQKLYPDPSHPLRTSIDVPETLSNLLGKYIKKISPNEVELENGEKIDLNNLDYKLIKPLIWW